MAAALDLAENRRLLAAFLAPKGSPAKMSIASVVVVFVLSWWFCFFLALPFGARPRANPETGHAESAPARPRIGLKALIATVGGALMTVAIWQIIHADLISFRYTEPTEAVSDPQ